MTRTFRIGVVVVAAVALAACLNPDGRRPGLRLTGELASAHPTDWQVANEHREVAIEVTPPYRIPHSVTIWCAGDGDALWVGARSPDEKRWPGWVAARPEVRLKIGGTVYEARLRPLDPATDAAELERLGGAYAAKYDIPSRRAEDAPPIRYWRVEPR